MRTHARLARRFAARTLATFIALALAPSLATAQRGDDLRTAFREVAFEWARADAGAVVRHMVPTGILIDASDGRMGPLTDRQATAAAPYALVLIVLAFPVTLVLFRQATKASAL